MSDQTATASKPQTGKSRKRKKTTKKNNNRAHNQDKQAPANHSQSTAQEVSTCPVGTSKTADNGSGHQTVSESSEAQVPIQEGSNADDATGEHVPLAATKKEQISTFNLKGHMAEMGHSKEAITRLEAARMRLGIPADDTMLGILLEMEGYIKLFEQIPNIIETTHKSAAEQAKQQSQKILNDISLQMSKRWMETSEQMIAHSIRVKKMSMLVWCCFVLFLVSATSMGTYALLNSQLPNYVTDPLVTGFVAIDWFLGLLNVPLWWVLMGLLVALSVLKATEYGFKKVQERDD